MSSICRKMDLPALNPSYQGYLQPYTKYYKLLSYLTYNTLYIKPTITLLM